VRAARAVDALTPQERQRLAVELARHRREQATTAAIPRRSTAGPVPASFAQRRLWMVDQVVGSNPVYNSALALTISGPLDRSAMRRVFMQIVRRHEVLRTVFHDSDDGPVQVVRPAPIEGDAGAERHWRELDFPRGEEAGLRAVLREEVRRPFDLVRGPLVRVTLVRLSPQEHVLCVVMHHVICDGASVGVLGREVAALYEAYANGRESPLAELPVQYGDFAIWQRARLTRPALQPHLDYWRAQLEGMPGLLALPSDRPRPPRATHRGALEPFALRVQPAALQALARREGLTAFMVVLAGLAVVLARSSGQTDLCIGTSVSGRPRPELERLCGFFVNSLPVRCRVDSVASVRDLLVAVKHACLGAIEHQSLPFETLVEELQPQRDVSHNPLFQVMLVMLEAAWDHPTLPGLDVARFRLDPGVAKFDLTVYLQEDGGRLRGEVEFSTDLYDASTIRRLMGRLDTVLGAFAAQPEVAVGDVPLLDADELEAVTTGPNRTEWPFPADLCMHQLFEARVREEKDVPALIHRGLTLTYGDLNTRANHLAASLRANGVGPGVRVALVLDRSPGAVIAILAVLKAGGAYVPLDASYPPARRDYMLRDCRPGVVITSEGLAGTLPGGSWRLIRLDGPAGAVAGASEADPIAAAEPSGTAYVIYTSGSTGDPRGVVLDHRGRVNNVLDINTRYGVGSGDRLLSVSSVSFDMFVYDVFGMLMSGGSLVLPAAEDGLDASRWLDLMERQRVTVWNSAPVLLEMLTTAWEARPQARLPWLRLALLGGDWIPVGLPDRIRRLAPALRVVSLGGATEASIHSTIYPIGDVDPAWTSIPYGIPMANQTAFVLDGRGQPCPVGVAGELYLGGIGVGTGYFERPALTAERFLPDPHGTPGARLYRTGDVARWTPAGVLELLGRADRQVKVRGFRVELGDVVAALRRHPAVKDAVVLASGPPGGERKLIAHVVPHVWPPPPTADVRRHLRNLLPEYMVPSLLGFRPELPLTPNGKVDWRQLHDAAPPAGAEARPVALEGTPLEKLVAALVGHMLKTTVSALDADLFELGAHSLLMTQLVSRLRQALGLDLPIRAVFEQPTVAGIAMHLEALARQDGRSETVSEICRTFLEVNAMADEVEPRTAGGAGERA
jgi:amino acid adenylation domain-containing protein